MYQKHAFIYVFKQYDNFVVQCKYESWSLTTDYIDKLLRL